MRDVIETFKFQENGVDFSVDVICYHEFALFSQLWEMTDEHQGGVTIRNPEAGRNSYAYAIPKMDSLASRSAEYAEYAEYAKQGKADPSRRAYEEMQSQLKRDINASDYGFIVSAQLNGVSLFEEENLGCSFDYSYEDGSLIEEALRVFEEHDIKSEAVALAKQEAKNILDNANRIKELAQ